MYYWIAQSHLKRIFFISQSAELLPTKTFDFLFCAIL